MKKILLFSLFCSFVFASCYRDKVDELYPARGLFIPCDPAYPDSTHLVSYSGDIVPVLQGYCYSCHSGSSPTSTYHLDDYASVYLQAANGNLWGDLSAAHNFHPMPPTFAIDSCYLRQLDYWINIQGAPNN